jgi:hypothetical protein
MKVPNQEQFFEDSPALKNVKNKNIETGLGFFTAFYIIVDNPFYPII